MKTFSVTRREILGSALAAASATQAPAQSGVTKYVRFRAGSRVAHGIVEGDTVREIKGDLFGQHSPTGPKHKMSAVKLLYPVQPTKILALAGNYRSHIGNKPPAAHPEPFYKPISCLQNPEDPILISAGATNVHYEGERVVVMGKRASKISVAEAKDAIFGVTCGNDVSEREWQNGSKKDVQWWRAKGADTYGPLGPVIARGVEYGQLKIQTRLNGETVQSDNTSNLIHDCPTTVSFISQFVVLMPGDLIFTGTSGSTKKMGPGDIVEIDIEGIGVLKNKVAAG
jgi:2-keto-4-pentenoate hydratase/2-oxohepta-3-ene-1,7-dioic acid hydratase in catechol pathway